MLAFVLWGEVCAAQARRFERISPHCYMLVGEAGSANVGAVVTESGVLMVNPPPERQLSAALDALKRLTPKPVRWCVHTDFRQESSGGASVLSRQGVFVFTSREIRKAAVSASPSQSKDSVATAPGTLLVFERQMRLFPENVEVRVSSLEKKWQDGGAVTVFVPAEKVLMVGDIFTEGSLPGMERGSERPSALLWLEAMREVIDSVPLLKSAMPPPRPDPAKSAEEPKTLEELVTVVSSNGPRSTLQAMKDLLAESQRLRAGVARAVSQRRSRDSFLENPGFDPFRGLGNFESFATRLYDELNSR
jgi:hypothetical protein